MPTDQPSIFRRGISACYDFIIFSNIFIGLCTVAQGLLTYELLNIPASFSVLAMLFCSTVGLYNFAMLLQKPANPEKSKHRRVRWFYRHYRLVVSITLISTISIIPLALFMSLTSLVLLAFLGITSVAYNLPLFSFQDRRFGLRNIPGLKLFLIAFVWALSSVLYPVVEYGHDLSMEKTVALIGFNFLFITAITIPFDIRDLFQDAYYQMKTLPVLLGERKARYVSQACLIGCWILLLLLTRGITPHFIGLGASLILTHYIVNQSSKSHNEFYYFFYLDGLMIFQLLLVLCSNWINHITWGIS